MLRPFTYTLTHLVHWGLGHSWQQSSLWDTSYLGYTSSPVSSSSLSGGRRSCLADVSWTIPRKVKVVVGPSNFSEATNHLLARTVLRGHMPSIWPTALFNHYTGTLDWIMVNNYGAQLQHYLDDFLLVSPPGKDTCQEAMSRMMMVCDLLGMFHCDNLTSMSESVIIQTTRDYGTFEKAILHSCTTHHCVPGVPPGTAELHR